MSEVELKRFKDVVSRHGNLNLQKVRAESDLSNAEKQLQEALQEMKTKFGVSNLEELRELYAKISAESKSEIDKATLQLDSVEARIKEVQESLK